MPPAWAVLAMVVLGFNEFLALLYNPLYILLGLVLFLFGRTVYQARPRPRARRPCAQAEHIGASNSIDTWAAARAQVGAGRLLCRYKNGSNGLLRTSCRVATCSSLWKWPDLKLAWA